MLTQRGTALLEGAMKAKAELARATRANDIPRWREAARDVLSYDQLIYQYAAMKPVDADEILLRLFNSI